MKNTKVIVFSDTKGGVGKTTSVINVAYSIPLVEKNATVLVIDTDAQANSTQTVLLDDDIYWEKNLADLFTKMSNGYKPTIEDIAQRIYRPVYLSTAKEYIKEKKEWDYVSKPLGFDILPTCISMQILEMKKSMGKDNSKRTGLEADLILKEIIDIIKTYFDYDYILIDCPPNMGTFVNNAMMASDYMMIPTGSGTYSLKGIEYTTILAEVLKSTRNHTIKMLGVFSTMYKKGLSSQYTDEKILLDFPTIDKFLTDIPNTVQVENTTIEGNIISITNKRIGACYKLLTKEMLWKINNFDKVLEERAARSKIITRINEIKEILDDIYEGDINKETYENLIAEETELLGKIKELEDKRRKEVGI